MIPSSAAAVPEEWTIPPRGVYTVFALSATVPLCADDAVTRPRPRTHAPARISILIDTKHNSRHKTRVVHEHMENSKAKKDSSQFFFYDLYGLNTIRESVRASTSGTISKLDAKFQYRVKKRAAINFGIVALFERYRTQNKMLRYGR